MSTAARTETVLAHELYPDIGHTCLFKPFLIARAYKYASANSNTRILKFFYQVNRKKHLYVTQLACMIGNVFSKPFAGMNGLR